MIYGFKETFTYTKKFDRNLSAINISKSELNHTSSNLTSYRKQDSDKNLLMTLKEICKHLHFVLLFWIVTLMTDEFLQVIIYFSFI